MEIGPGEPISATFFARRLSRRVKKHMPLNGYFGGRGHLQVINQEQMDSRSVVLSAGFVWSRRSEVEQR